MPIKFSRKKNSKGSLQTGVYKDKKSSNKWYAQISFNNELIKSSLVNSEKQATNEYKKLCSKYKSFNFQPFNIKNVNSNSTTNFNDVNHDQITNNSKSNSINIDTNDENNNETDDDIIYEDEDNDEIEDEDEDEDEIEDGDNDEIDIDENIKSNSKKRKRISRELFQPNTEPTYKRKSKNPKVVKVNRKIISKILPRKNFLQIDKDKKLMVQENKCNICTNILTIDKEFDHIIPRRYEGKDKYINMQFLCRSCHNWKSNHLDTKFIKNIINDNKFNKNFEKIIDSIILFQKKEYYDYYLKY